MADSGTPPPKNGDTGPERSLRTPSRTTPPANKREYYKAGVLPGNGKRISPTGSRSTSAEPTERPQTPTDHQPPHTETTPRAKRVRTHEETEHTKEEQMDEMALEAQEAEEIAKDCKLDYHAVNK